MSLFGKMKAETHLEVNKEALNKAKALLREDLRISILTLAA